MFALEPPAVQSVVPADQPDVIEVVGTRTGETLKIDRRTYRVQQTPHSAQKDSLQLLRGLPAITITPDDKVNLLGAPNVKILIDGHDTRTDLHTLHGSDIDRIEIITNPSAQYSAEGTGGIINIVLRKKQDEGTSGNAALEASSYGAVKGNGTLKYKKGKWTYEVTPNFGAGNWIYSTYHKRRSFEAIEDGPFTINTEDGGGPGEDDEADLALKATYDLDAKTSLSAQGFGGAAYFRTVNRARFVGLTPDFESFSQRQIDGGHAIFFGGVLMLDHKGTRDGETLKASASLFGNPDIRRFGNADFSDGGFLRNDRHMWSLYSQDKIDWQHPIGKKQILSLGAAWDLQQVDQRYRFTSLEDGVSTGAADAFNGLQSTVAAYSTFQQQLGGWTIMPGLRVERNRRHITSPGLPDVDIGHTDLLPSLHVEHPIGKSIVLTLSYSKRLDRPQIDDLRPYSVRQDVVTIYQGNPHLRDQSTDSYEVNLHYHRKKIDAGLIVYDRETKRLMTNGHFVNEAGQIVITPINAGHKRDRGAEFDFNMPILKRVKASVSVNFFSSRVPIDAVASDASDERFRFTTNSTLEWDGPEHQGKPGDIAQLVWHYESPSTDFQIRNFAWHQLTLSYTHNLTKKLSLTATADSGELNNGHRLIAPLVQEFYSVHRRPVLKIKLMKTFGKP